VRECRASLLTGEIEARLSVKPDGSTQLDLAAVDDVEASYRPSGSISGTSSQVRGMQIIKVAALVLRLSTTADGRLQLMFDGSTAASRRLIQLMAAVP